MGLSARQTTVHSDLYNTFIDSLPTRVRVLPEKGTRSFKVPRKNCLDYRWLAANEGTIAWSIIDVDRQGAAISWEEASLPTPNMIVSNPENGHAQLFYRLADPVYAWPSQRGNRAYRYFQSIEDAMVFAAGGDPAFANYVAKNPFHPVWRRQELHNHAYELGELAEYVDLRRRYPRAANDHWEGRNCTLFNQLRLWAYQHHKVLKGGGIQECFMKVLSTALSMNTVENPLPACEVRTIAKSVSNFVYFRYAPKKARGRDKILLSPTMSLTEKQQISAHQTNRLQREQSALKITQAITRLRDSGKKVTKSSVAWESGIHRSTISKQYANLFEGS